MQVIEWDYLEGSNHDAVRPSALTIGVFDGVHVGHRTLIEKVLAAPGDLERTVITFRENPKLILHPDTFHGEVLTLEQKLESLEETGIGTCVLIDFSGNFSKLTGTVFLSALVRLVGVRYLAIGTDFRCGYRLSTDAQGVRTIGASMGVETEIVDPVLYSGRPVSSSRIRRAVQEGRLPDAFAMLGRPYVIDFRNLTPTRTAGYVRFDEIRQVLPPPGEYSAETSDGNTWLKTRVRVLSVESAQCEVAGGFYPRFLRFSGIR